MKRFLQLPLRIGVAVLAISLIFFAAHHALGKEAIVGLCLVITLLDFSVRGLWKKLREKRKGGKPSAPPVAVTIIGILSLFPKCAASQTVDACEADKVLVAPGDAVSLMHWGPSVPSSTYEWQSPTGTIGGSGERASWHITNVPSGVKALRADLRRNGKIVCSVEIWLRDSFLSGQTTATEWLVRNTPPPTTFGLYTYLLFTKPPASLDPDFLKQLLTAYFKSSWTMEQLRGHLPDKLINAFFLPVLVPPPNRLSQNIEWVSLNIDPVYSAQLLARLPGTHSDNPYLAVCDHALHAEPGQAGSCIVHDLSLVPSSLIPEWIETIERQALQGTALQSWTLDSIALQCKTVLTVIGGTAVHISDSWSEIEKIVQFQEKPPDSPK